MTSNQIHLDLYFKHTPYQWFVCTLDSTPGFTPNKISQCNHHDVNSSVEIWILRTKLFRLATPSKWPSGGLTYLWVGADGWFLGCPCMPPKPGGADWGGGAMPRPPWKVQQSALVHSNAGPQPQGSTFWVTSNFSSQRPHWQSKTKQWNSCMDG